MKPEEWLETPEGQAVVRIMYCQREGARVLREYRGGVLLELGPDGERGAFPPIGESWCWETFAMLVVYPMLRGRP